MPLQPVLSVQIPSSPELRDWLWHLMLYLVGPLVDGQVDEGARGWTGDFAGDAAFSRSAHCYSLLNAMPKARPSYPAGALRQTLDPSFFQQRKRKPIAVTEYWIVRIDEESPAHLTFVTQGEWTQMTLEVHSRLLEDPWVLPPIATLQLVITAMVPQTLVKTGPNVNPRDHKEIKYLSDASVIRESWLEKITMHYRAMLRGGAPAERMTREKKWLEQGLRWALAEAQRRDPADVGYGAARLKTILAAVLAPPGQDPPGYGPRIHFHSISPSDLE